MEIIILNRIPLGLCVGWTMYVPEENIPTYELSIHLLLIDLIFRW